jgi:hypothetical protein
MAAAAERRRKKSVKASLGHVAADQPRAHGDNIGIVLLARKPSTQVLPGE